VVVVVVIVVVEVFVVIVDVVVFIFVRSHVFFTRVVSFCHLIFERSCSDI